MWTILDGTQTAMAESGLPMKYWTDTVQTVVYVQNLLSNSQQPKTISAELWSRQCQDISHLRPFGCTSYVHVLLDLNLSKLSSRLSWLGKTTKSLFIFSFLFFSLGLTTQKGVQESVTSQVSQVTVSHDGSHDKCGKVVHRPCSSL